MEFLEFELSLAAPEKLNDSLEIQGVTNYKWISIKRGDRQIQIRGYFNFSLIRKSPPKKNPKENNGNFSENDPDHMKEDFTNDTK